MQQNHGLLIYGYGNPGRQDDGLGNAMIEKLEEYIAREKIDHVKLDSNYQLNIEDAVEMNGNDFVLFVDASLEEGVEDFSLSRVQPSDKVEFTMHSTSPGFILNLCRELYGSAPRTYLLHIKGYSWDLKEDLTEGARQNLDKAFQYVKKVMLEPGILERTDCSKN
jgi:hydrogenase maturation protease